MKKVSEAKSKEIIRRNCAVCGEKLVITTYPDRTYSGGHYFGKLSAGKIKSEYWECDDCFNE
ncbi:MAG: hypothetical protein A2Z24_02570 [Candidatus Woykebacteria bacterium RBG_16_44_10]|uniref:Uncharacterized protein n=1 Tax=Candidatus Woykebacteria bacterium RBG_16_44_10 TaxID=1802597 RepID=A0A1G1WE77_9BACT|nr:MAG: hypothetical protein A2Z24_02570 [Candidatus Woykebacteria bacterium RBG_16_44_10]